VNPQWRYDDEKGYDDGKYKDSFGMGGVGFGYNGTANFFE
jgi:hypothetical protein